MERYDTPPTPDLFAPSMNFYNALVAELHNPATGRLPHHELEELLDRRGRLLLRQLLQDHLDLRALREETAARTRPPVVIGPDRLVRPRLEKGHHRQLATLFGTVAVRRCAWRRPGTTNVYPADVALSLPRRRHSYSLARLAVLESVRASFDTATEAICRRCGPVIGKRQVEDLVVDAAVDIDAFYRARIPTPCTADTLLVISVDGKGIVMRPEALRPATQKAAARPGLFRTRLAAGEKPARKRMATLAAVYDAVPAPRRPHDVIAPPGGRHGQRRLRPGPHAVAKWLYGS
ncbi:ISKra4 family transposase, partial [Streptomyces sp. NPDC059003]